MAEDVLYEKISGESQGETEPNSLLQILRNRINKPVQAKVDSILLDVQKLTDNEKLFLYLQLPPGPTAPEKSSQDTGSVSTAEHMYACTWIRNHLEEHTDTCLPKQDVYDSYKRYCDNLCCRPLSVANFGKIIREIFPNIKARRLGGRGQSKYPFTTEKGRREFGLRRKSMVSMPPLPSLDLKMAESFELTDFVQSYSNDVINASCALICNWAEKILKRSFNNVVEVAHFLIQQHIINPRSANAELVLSMVLSGTENSQTSSLKSQKQPVEAAENKSPESSEGGNADAAVKNKGTNLHPGNSLPVKKRPPEPQKVVSSPQVDALMAKLPTLLPRFPSEEKFGSPSPPIRFTPPVLATKILHGSLNVSPLPFTTVPSGASLTVTTGMNGASLVSQPIAPPVISMILPDVISLENHPLPKASQNCTKDTTGGGGREGKATKRHAVTLSAGSVDISSKRKRGRPRKVYNSQDILHSSTSEASLNTETVVTGETSSDQSKETNSDCGSTMQITAAPTGDITQGEVPTGPDCRALESLLRDTDVKEKTVNLPVLPRVSELQESPSAGDSRVPGDTAPIQVSVIQDGRQSAAQWTARNEECKRGHKVSEESSVVIPVNRLMVQEEYRALQPQ
ncbi:DNA-binding protein RFX5 [Rhinophrynus dorsalis]